MNFGFRKGFDWNNRFMKKDYVEIAGEKYLVSTVDLGLDHQYVDGGPPLYYETMIFPNGDMGELFLERYTTEQQAIDGHEKVLNALKKGKYTMDEYGFIFEEEN